MCFTPFNFRYIDFILRKTNENKAIVDFFFSCLFLRPPPLHRWELCLRADQNHLVVFAAPLRVWPGRRLLPHHQLHHHDPHASQAHHQVQEEAAVRPPSHLGEARLKTVGDGTRLEEQFDECTLLCRDVPHRCPQALLVCRMCPLTNPTEYVSYWNIDTDVHNVNSYKKNDEIASKQCFFSIPINFFFATTKTEDVTLYWRILASSTRKRDIYSVTAHSITFIQTSTSCHRWPNARFLTFHMLKHFFYTFLKSKRNTCIQENLLKNDLLSENHLWSSLHQVIIMLPVGEWGNKEINNQSSFK